MSEGATPTDESPGTATVDLKLFETDDLPILLGVIGLIPDLDIAAYATKLANSYLKFPIVDHDSLRPLFDVGLATFQGRRFTFSQAVDFIPKEFFPMESLDAFTRRILIALQRGRAIHDLEATQRAGPPFEPHEHLPSPIPFPPAPRAAAGKLEEAN